jgi:hypothetical protein
VLFRRALSGYAFPEEDRIPLIKEKNMKETIIRIIVVTLLLLASGTAPVLADGIPAPACYPKPCPLVQ